MRQKCSCAAGSHKAALVCRLTPAMPCSPSPRCVDLAFMELTLCLAYYAMRSTLLRRHLTFCARAPRAQDTRQKGLFLTAALRNRSARFCDAKPVESRDGAGLVADAEDDGHSALHNRKPFPTNAAASLSVHFPQSKDSKVESSLRIRCPY